MGKGLIIAVIVIAIAAVAGYMLLYSGGTPGLGDLSQITDSVSGAATGELPAEIAVDEEGATEASTQAEESVSDIEQEIAAADGLELPDLE